MEYKLLLVGAFLLVIIFFLLRKLSKTENNRSNNSNESFFERETIEELKNEEDDLPPGFYSAEPILQDLYNRKRITYNDFIHYNRFNPRDLGQELLDDRVCSEMELPYDLRRYLNNEED